MLRQPFCSRRFGTRAEWRNRSRDGYSPEVRILDEPLKFAPRYEVTVDGLAHDEYLSDGVLADAFLASSERRRIYERVCAFVLRFLDVQLKGISDSLDPRDILRRVTISHLVPCLPSAWRFWRWSTATVRKKPSGTFESFGEDLRSESLCAAGAILLEKKCIQESAWIGVGRAMLVEGPRAHQLEGEVLAASGDKAGARTSLRELRREIWERRWRTRPAAPHATAATTLMKRLRPYLSDVAVPSYFTRIVPHQLRHTYASEMVRAGGKPACADELLGHVKAEMTMKYVLVARRPAREFHLPLSPGIWRHSRRRQSFRLRGFGRCLSILRSSLTTPSRMFRRSLPDGPPRHRHRSALQSLTKILSEIRKLNHPDNGQRLAG